MYLSILGGIFTNFYHLFKSDLMYGAVCATPIVLTILFLIICLFLPKAKTTRMVKSMDCFFKKRNKVTFSNQKKFYKSCISKAPKSLKKLWQNFLKNDELAKQSFMLYAKDYLQINHGIMYKLYSCFSVFALGELLLKVVACDIGIIATLIYMMLPVAIACFMLALLWLFSFNSIKIANKKICKLDKYLSENIWLCASENAVAVPDEKMQLGKMENNLELLALKINSFIETNNSKYVLEKLLEEIKDLKKTGYLCKKEQSEINNIIDNLESNIVQ
ncbi:MAG: hypothetical protein RR454_01325 [Clostridia bacterium]